DVNAGFFRKKIKEAIGLRETFIPPGETEMYRLVNAESDGIPGLIVDRYGEVLVIQCLSAGIEFWRDVIVEHLIDLTGIQKIFERSDVEVRKLEGLTERVGPLHGNGFSKQFQMNENGLNFWIDIAQGHKTGFYLDQRRNRAVLRGLVNKRIVLDCFSYSGAFSVSALAGGAEKVISLDSSSEALQICEKNVELNGFSNKDHEIIEGDVFTTLRTFRDKGMSFDAIILDPPKFAPTVALKQRAARGYKDINLLAFKLLRQNGLLFSFSCSGGISSEFFQQIVAGAALDAGVQVRIMDFLSQSPDHPIAINFPEGRYLKGLICHVSG
ncbi:MAG: class I SAM-dependent rRNA methyltransferase, partial [Anaerolineaceae bacterium]|nr:class I SAM-dependent rRNA methyltransferase [Anaerolineaceae bacterium]